MFLKFQLIIWSLILTWSQAQDSLAYKHINSEYYHEMVPVNIDSINPVIVLPKILDKETFANTINMRNEDSLDIVYPLYQKFAQQEIEDIKVWVQKTSIPYEIVEASQKQGNRSMISPELIVKHKVFVSNAYHFVDMGLGKQYGFTTGFDITSHKHYFKDLAKYRAKILKYKSKSPTLNNTTLETLLQKRQRQNQRFKKYVLRPILYVGGIVAVFAIGLMLN